MQEGEFKVTLGTEDLTVPALTLDQIKRICLALGVSGNAFTDVGFEAEREIILAGLSEIKPDLTVASLGKVRMGRKKMGAIVKAVLVAAEIIDPDKPKAAAPGEVPAGTASA